MVQKDLTQLASLGGSKSAQTLGAPSMLDVCPWCNVLSRHQVCSS